MTLIGLASIGLAVSAKESIVAWAFMSAIIIYIAARIVSIILNLDFSKELEEGFTFMHLLGLALVAISLLLGLILELYKLLS